MRISFSLINLAIGGAQNFIVQLAEGLYERGHILSYLVYSNIDDPIYSYPELFFSLDKICNRVRYPWELWSSDVIHLDGYHSFVRKLLLLPQWGKVVETYHSSYSVKRSGPLYPRFRVAVSQSVGNLLPGSPQIIYQGVSTPIIPQHNKKLYDLAILGRIHPVKNHLLFLKVCERLFEHRGYCSVLIIGDHFKPGPYQQVVDSTVSRLQRIGIKIDRTGNVPYKELWDWLFKVRILLITSHREGFGRMAIEAMAAGVPVVANPVGGLLEIVQSGKNGFFAERDDVSSFLEHIELLLNDDALRNQLGMNARSFVKASFPFDRMVTEFETLFYEIAKKY